MRVQARSYGNLKLKADVQICRSIIRECPTGSEWEHEVVVRHDGHSTW